MENNEQETTEEVVDSSTEDVKDEEQSGDEDTKDWKAEALKYKAIADRKEKKLQEKPQTEEIIKPNTEQSGLSREEGIFFAQGGTEESLKDAKMIAERDGISILAAKEDEYFKFQETKRADEVKAKSNQLGASGGSPTSQGHKAKPLNKMTREEHEADIKAFIKD